MELVTEEGLVFGGYEARPEGAARGGVIVLHEAFGVTPHIKKVCDGYAQDGYRVLAPALFAAAPDVRGGEAPVLAQDKAGLDEGRRLIGSIPEHEVAAMVRACADELRAEGLKVATVGYCWGGSVSYYCAAQLPEISACVAYYGGMLEQLAARYQPACPTLVHLARLDRYIPVEAATAAFARHNPAAEVHVYEADHGFNRDDGRTWDPTAAATARARTLDFLTKTIG